MHLCHKIVCVAGINPFTVDKHTNEHSYHVMQVSFALGVVQKGIKGGLLSGVECILVLCLIHV